MQLDDVLPTVDRQRRRRVLTTPLRPLFWFARIVRRVTRGFALRLGLWHRHPWLARRLGVRPRLDYRTSYLEIARMADAEALTGPSEPGKTLEDVWQEIVAEDEDDLGRWLRLRTRFEAERVASAVQDQFKTFRGRSRRVDRRVIDALHDRRSGGGRA